MTTAPSSPSSQEPRLESWKEIAAYLNRDSRTVRRWEQSEGLPVHRHRHLTRSSVYAFPSELDAWRANRKPEPAKAPPEEPRLLSGWRRATTIAAMMILALSTAGGGRVTGRVFAADQAAPIASRLVWTVPRETANFVSDISPDERYVSYMDKGDLTLHDLRTGQDRRLTRTGREEPPQEFAQVSAFDRVGQHIAYAWYSGREPAGTSLRVIRVEAGADAEPRVVYSNPDVGEIYPYDWTPDGQWIAVGIVRRDRTIQVGLVSATDGSFRALKSMEWRVFGNIALSPDGRHLAVDLPETSDTGARDVFVLAVDGSRETVVATGRGREVLVAWSPDGQQIIFESDRSGSSSLWTVPVAEGKPAGPASLIKADLGSMSALGISARGRLHYVARSFPRQVVQLGAFDFGTGRIISAAEDLPMASRAYATHTPEFSPDGKYLAHLSVDYASAGQLPLADQRITIRSLSTGQVHRELRPQPELEVIGSLSWAPDSRSLVAQGRNRRGRYGLFRIDAETGAMATLVLDDPGPAVTGMTGWAPDGTKIYYGKHFRTPAPGAVAVYERDLKSNTEREIFRRPGGPAGGSTVSPDGAFVVTATAARGRISAGTEALLLIPTGSGPRRELMPVAEASSVRFVSWSSDGRSMFVGKLPEGGQPEMWRVPVAASTPTRIGAFSLGEQITSLRVHPDGRRIVFEREEEGPLQPNTVWVLENFLPAAKR